MDPTAQVIGALEGVGLQTYAIASGQPYTTSSVGGVTTISTGSESYLPYILGAVVLGIIAWIVLK
jgi:hypothetical protein